MFGVVAEAEENSCSCSLFLLAIDYEYEHRFATDEPRVAVTAGGQCFRTAWHCEALPSSADDDHVV
jgi:hypothetical protein